MSDSSSDSDDSTCEVVLQKATVSPLTQQYGKKMISCWTCSWLKFFFLTFFVLSFALAGFIVAHFFLGFVSHQKITSDSSIQEDVTDKEFIPEKFKSYLFDEEPKEPMEPMDPKESKDYGLVDKNVFDKFSVNVDTTSKSKSKKKNKNKKVVDFYM